MTCEHPSMVTMDHGGGPFGEKVQTANRMCLKCGQHWYGPMDAIKEYTRSEWDAWVSEIEQKGQQALSF